MLRKILGFAVLAVVAFFALRLAFGLLGVAVGLAFVVLKLALIGLAIYWVLKLVAPSTARKVDEMIKGERPAA
jgi:type III secretory pathway component EscR